MSTEILSTPADDRIWLDTVKDYTKEQIFAHVESRDDFWLKDFDSWNISLGNHDDETKSLIVKNLGKYYFAWRIAAESLTSKQVMFDLIIHNIGSADFSELVDTIRTNCDVPQLLLDYTEYFLQRYKNENVYHDVIACYQIDWDDEYAEERNASWCCEFSDEEASLARLWLRLERHLWLNKIEWTPERREMAQQAIIANRAIIPELNPSGIAAFMDSLLSDDQVEAHELPELEISL